MAIIESDSVNPNRNLLPEDYTAQGEINSLSGDLALVVGCAQRAESYITSKQWNLLWRDADMLYQSPRPMSVYENTYVLEPNVQRFTVAKTVNAIVPSLYKGLFYADPPMILRPRPGTHQSVTDAKTAMASYMLDQSDFRMEVKWGLEQMGNLGTSVWKWGVEYKKVLIETRQASVTKITDGPESAQVTEDVGLDEPPVIKVKEKIVPRPFLEHKDLERVLVDPHTRVGDIRRADFVIDIMYMDFYQIKALKDGIEALDKESAKEWHLPKTDEALKEWWMPPSEALSSSTNTLTTDQASLAHGLVHHALAPTEQVSPDLLLKKLEVAEYWDKGRKITVVDRKKVIQTGKNPFLCLPFLSANWWNRPKSFYGMGLGLIIGQNQRVDQGTINSILKILSFGVNPVYLRSRAANAPTQMIRTGLGKIITVDGETDKAYHLMETPKVPPDIWSALKESQQASESASGADQMLVQGSTAGPRSSMGRTAGGAGILSNASATRLDGPLDNFIEQVFKPYLYILDRLVFKYVSDAEIQAILGEELGEAFEVDLQKYHNAVIEYEVLAGSSLAAKRTMAQSLTLITQIFNNPNLQQNLAEINEEYIDFKPILKMWMEASEWKNVQDIIKPLTPQMKQRMQQNSAAGQANGKLQQQMALNAQKAQLKQQSDDQATDGRIKRDLVREAFRTEGSEEAIEGVPASGGLEGQMPQIA